MPSAAPSIRPSQSPSIAPTELFNVYVEYRGIEDSDYLTPTAVVTLLSLIEAELEERNMNSEVSLLSNLGNNVIQITIDSRHATAMPTILSRPFENALTGRLRETDTETLE